MTSRTERLKNVPAGDSITATLRWSTIQMNGPQRLSVDANPGNDQPELYHYNNIAFRNFYVNKDRRNPLLDVTFDGAHIMDGDLISPKPEITLSLTDDNPFLPIQDTATFSLTLTEPDGLTRQIAWNDPAVLFFPGDANNLPQKNRARLEWRPEFTKDGDYILMVNGRDASGNLSGTLDYAVNFRVITRSSLSNVLNYPNPFSTSTCFVYTMTGAETPAHFKIQIMTVSGRVVREITESEFGPLQAGTHISNFCWDGRDEEGVEENEQARQPHHGQHEEQGAGHRAAGQRIGHRQEGAGERQSGEEEEEKRFHGVGGGRVRKSKAPWRPLRCASGG